ncbi:MAG TPA: tetratricopeptide repeat protein [Candidatus Angelobacter sp.]
MKCFRRFPRLILLLLAVSSAVLAAWASMPLWMQGIDARSVLDTVIFRTVPLPGGSVTIRRPPAETIPALGTMIKSEPHPEELYSLRALEEEQALDFTAAELDWKSYLQTSPNKPAAQLALADFYHRRHRPMDEVNALSVLGRMPGAPAEKLTAVADQQSWRAFERIFKVIDAQALPRTVAVEQYRTWIQRYPQEQSLYSRYFEFLLAEKNWIAARQTIAEYQKHFPEDEIFLTKARALLAYRQGAVEQGLAVYDRNFKPLWPDELLKNYFDLLKQTQESRRFLLQAQKALARNPDDFNAASRIFHFYRQEGNLDAAERSLTTYRLKKESRSAHWSTEELYTFAQLLERSQRYPEAARYYFALYNSGNQKGAEQALAGLAHILLEAPEQEIRFGTEDLSMYSNIATMDRGPGYLNGILSLILNDTSPAEEYSKENTRAAAYFHRSRAADLVALLDKRFPDSQELPALHSRLIEIYAEYRKDDAVIRFGREFLQNFPHAEQRARVALLMADIYAARDESKEEFELYEALLKELASKAEGVPLGENVAGTGQTQQEPFVDEYHSEPHNEIMEDRWGQTEYDSSEDGQQENAKEQAFSVSKKAPDKQAGPRSPEYAHVLEMYLARLAAKHAIPEALVVLRHELDHNPDDPGLYERFAQFLEQNALGTEQEALYKRAIQKFPGTSWYEKMARWYLRHSREDDFQSLTKRVCDIFSGSQLQEYFQQVRVPATLSLAVERYAHQRFPHNLSFVKELVSYYRANGPTADWEALLRQYWYEDASLRNMFFEYLSRTGRLESELQQLKKEQNAGQKNWVTIAQSNPAAARFAAEAELWRSHYEEAAPALGAVAGIYPADLPLGREASSVYRSLAWFKPANTQKAAAIELNLLRANPLDRDTLARIGDIYADQAQFIKAAPFWNRMPQTEPGNADAYEEAATVFWDYYMFDDALRLLDKGRARLNNDALYSYQAGAIYENKRDYPKAIAEYVKGALEQGTQSPSYSRLLQLASRRTTAAQVDAATQVAVSESGFDIQAIRLRADVLQAQSHTRELASLVDTAVKQVDSFETLQAMDALAIERGLDDVHCRILERESALTSDPLDRMRLQYSLAGFYESHKNYAAAEQKIESLYRENPRLLGVVRNTVDFYWRNKQPRRAITVLLQAAADAYPELGNHLKYEAARKMTETGEYARAREMLNGLLQQSPYEGEYMAATAETYARAGDNSGLRDFYLKQIALFREAKFSASERKSQIANLRRGLIPALTGAKDYAGAVDQYIELINAYPDDDSLSSEAALYAERHGRAAQIINFYKKTVEHSPRDPRWVIVLARLETTAEDYQGAIATYSQAIGIRPDRVDLLTARANLEERLLRFDEAAADYATLYDRTYHDPAWMEKEAEVRARQDKPELTVKALETVFVDKRLTSSQGYSTVADRLERWGMLAQARVEVEKGIEAAGSDLLANSQNHSAARMYVRIMTRERMQEQAWQRLDTAINDAAVLPTWSFDGVKKGMDGVTEKEWREGILNQRRTAAHAAMAACMEEMGSAVRQYFTPEEKQAFLQFVEKKNAGMPRQDAHEYLLPLTRKAELAELEAQLLYEQMQTTPLLVNQYSRSALLNEFVDLQTRRLRLPELGQQLEELGSRRVSVCSQAGIECLKRAADAYRLANRPEDELRVFKMISNWNNLTAEERRRYFELLLARSPQTLLDWAAARDESRGNESADFILAHGGSRLAHEMIRLRGSAEVPVWKPAYTALAGLYFSESSPQIKTAFQRALADQTIGERLKVKGDRDRDLSGDTWFYYAGRYGEYLAFTRNTEAQEFLPAELEHTPASSDAYFETATVFQQYGDFAHAIEDYQHALDLSPDRVDAHTQLAAIYFQQKQKDAAIDEIKAAVAALKKQITPIQTQKYTVNIREFRDDFVDTVEQIKKMELFPEFKADLIGIFHDYVKRHSWGYLASFVKTLEDPRDPAAATALVLEVSRATEDPMDFLDYVARTNLGLKLQMEPILRRLVQVAVEEAQKKGEANTSYAQLLVERWRMKWLDSLLTSKQYDRLRDEIKELAKSSSPQTREAMLAIQLRLDATTGKLDSALSAYRSAPEQAPSGETLRAAAKQLEDAGDKQSARKVLEFVYQREIDDHQLTLANMLGLAEIRIEQGDLTAGLEILRRMTLVAGSPFEAQDPSAALLMRTGHAREAVPFLQELVTAVPWNADYRVRLAQAELAAKQGADSARHQLVAVAQDRRVAYQVRVSAAQAVGDTGKPEFDSRELTLIAASATPSPAEANQPFFFAARLRAAERSDIAPRTALLWASLEEFPSEDAPRLPLMRAAMKAGEYHLAIAAMKPFLRNHWLQMNSWSDYYYDPYSRDLDDDLEADDDSYQPDEEAGVSYDEFAPDLGNLSAGEKAEVLEQIGLAFQKLGVLDEALSSFERASTLHPAHAVARRLKSEIRDVQRALQQRREDRGRQPAIHSALEQNVIVRPRLEPVRTEPKEIGFQGGHQ